MMKRALAAGTLIASLAVSGVVGAVAAQDEMDTAGPVAQAAPLQSTTGTVVMQQNDDGRMVYHLDRGDSSEPIELSFGPAWFWGALDSLQALAEAAEGVTIIGHLRDGMPDGHASDVARERAAHAPRIKVRNPELRGKGKPPWAGGPKVVGEVHPGYHGWSKGQANKRAKPGKATKSDHPAAVGSKSG